MSAAEHGTDGSGAYVLEFSSEGPDHPVVDRLEVPSFASLHDLHEDIQACFGWPDSRAHAFVCDGTCYGTPCDAVPEWEDETLVPLSDLEGSRIDYYYDFAAGHHAIVQFIGHANDAAGWSRPVAGGCDADEVEGRLQTRMAQGIRDAGNTIPMASGVPMMALMTVLLGQPLPLAVDVRAMVPVTIGGSSGSDPSRISPEDAAADPDRYAIVFEDASSVPTDVAKGFLESHGLPVPSTDDFDAFMDLASGTAAEAGLMREWDESFLPGIMRRFYDSANGKGLYFMDAVRDPEPDEVLSWRLLDIDGRMSCGNDLMDLLDGYVGSAGRRS